MPEETSFSQIQDVVNMHGHDPVVIHDLQGAIDTYLKYGKGDTTDDLEIFYKGRTEWYGLIVTENSPLGPMLEYGAKKMHERGVFHYLKAEWLGGQKICRPVSDMSSSSLVLSLGHVSLVFVVLGFSIILSFVMFLAELLRKCKNH